MWCTADNHHDTWHTRAKVILESNFNQAVISKISIFDEIASSFTYSQKLLYFKHNWRLIDQQLLLYQLYGRGILGISFFIFASCDPLM